MDTLSTSPLTAIKPAYPHLVRYSTPREISSGPDGVEKFERELEEAEARMAEREDVSMRPVIDVDENAYWGKELRAATEAI